MNTEVAAVLRINQAILQQILQLSFINWVYNKSGSKIKKNRIHMQKKRKEEKNWHKTTKKNRRKEKVTETAL